MRKRKLIVAVFLLCYFAISGGVSSWADLVVKIGYVDGQKVLNEYQKTKDLMAKLQLEYEEKKQEMKEKIDKEKKEIEVLKEELLRREMTLLPSEREEMQKKIEEKTGELQALSQSIQEEMREKENEIYKKLDSYTPQIEKDIMAVIEDIAVKEGYRFIFNKGVLLYATPEAEFDLTEVVLSQLNQKYQVEQP